MTKIEAIESILEHAKTEMLRHKTQHLKSIDRFGEFVDGVVTGATGDEWTLPLCAASDARTLAEARSVLMEKLERTE